jgi:hypothetical protein
MAKLFSLLLAVLLTTPNRASAAPTTLHYSDGSPRWTYSIVSGMPSGESTMFYPDGAVMVRGTYKQGLKHGLFLYYTPDGSVKERSLFVHGDRKWRAIGNEKTKEPPITLLNQLAQSAPANTGALENLPLPFLPFAAVDRYSRRIGALLGTSSENGEMNGRRIEVFTHLVKDRYGLYLSASQSFLTAPKIGVRDQISFQQEQATLNAAATYFAGTVFDTHILGRVGYLRSFKSDPETREEVRGINGGQRAADFVATLKEVRAYRASASLVRRWRRFIGQLDLGLDVYSSAGPNKTVVDGSMLRFNAAAGYFYGNHWQFMLETANSSNSNGPGLNTYGATVNYLGGRLSWLSANMMADQDSEYSFVLSVGSFLLRFD